MKCTIETTKGPLTIILHPQISNLGALFIDLVKQGAYAGCHFDRVTSEYIQLEPPRQPGAHKYLDESHPLVKFGKRGTVVLLPDFRVAITIEATAPALELGSIIGTLEAQSVFVASEIANGKTLGESPKFPVTVQNTSKAISPKPTNRGDPDPDALVAPAAKRRIRMFEQAPLKPRKFKPNPSTREHDALFERVKAFEASL